jgi:polyisoprenoid-binding protein YceI
MLKMSLLALFATSALAIPTPHSAPATVRYTVAPASNEARYRVREQLLHHDLPNDAVGKTTAITGSITFATDGTIDTAASKITIDMTGLLTVHGVTRPTVWHVTAQSKDADVTGTGSTQFTFEDVSLAQPRVPVVLSVADTIKLEYDFHLVRAK